MSSIIRILPSELLTRIFTYVPAQNDIAACRLACRNFHELASPFLITEVVFALRLDTLTRLREIIGHAYFRKQITTLIYDTSRWSDSIATDWNEYVSQCEDSPRDLVDSEWTERQRRDARLLKSFSRSDCGLPASSTSASELSATEDLRDNDDQEMTSWDDHAFVTMEDYYENVYTMGCQRTFPDYYSRHKAQTTLEKNGTPRRILQEVFTRCPKLRHVVFTDYRGLAKHGESFDAMCKRLFGLTLQPQNLSELPAEKLAEDIATIFKAAASVPGARIESFEMDAHPYSSLRTANTVDPESALDVRATLNMRGGSPAMSSTLEEHASGLRAFGISCTDNHTDHAMRLRPLIQKSRDTLQRLSVSRTGETHMQGSDWLGFFTMHFPRLRYLDLRNLLQPALGPLQIFLDGHKTTLREVRLIAYSHTINASEEDSLANWAGQNMTLEGAEVITNADVDALYAANEDKDDAAIERILESIEERESRWLNGRFNMLSRSVDVAIHLPSEIRSLDWWHRPARLY